MEFMFLSRFWGNGEGRKEGEFQSLEVRLQLIALKNKNLAPKSSFQKVWKILLSA